MTTKKVGPERKTVTINGEEYEAADVDYGGKTYTLRELSVKENDEIEDASTDKDGKFNGRLHLRLCLTHSIVSPATNSDDIEKWPAVSYTHLTLPTTPYV